MYTGGLTHQCVPGSAIHQRQWTLEHRKPPMPSAHHPHYTQLWKSSSAWLLSIFKISIHTAVDFPIASLVLLKGTVTSDTSFLPCYSSAEHRQKYLFLPNRVSLLSSLSFQEPPALLQATWHAGSIWRALVLQTAFWQLKLFQQSQSQHNAWGNGNSWQISSSVFRYNVSSALRLS